MSIRPKLVLLLALLVVSAISVLGCGGSEPAPTAAPLSPADLPPSPTVTPTPTPISPQALLDGSSRVMEALESFHFRLHHESGSTKLLPSLLMDEAEGDVVRPDGISVEFSGSFGRFAIESGLITLGDDSYMTNPLSGKWESVPREVSPLGFFDPSRGIASMMSRVEGSSLLSSDGEVYRIGGTLPAEALAPLLGTTVEGTTVVVELTLDASDLYLLKAVVDGRVTPSDADDVVRVITLSRFNEPVTIEPPL